MLGVGGCVGCGCVFVSACVCTYCVVSDLLSVCPSVCLSVCRRSLAPNHNWFVRNAAYVLMNFLPSKSFVLQHIEGSHREIQDQARWGGGEGEHWGTQCVEPQNSLAVM